MLIALLYLNNFRERCQTGEAEAETAIATSLSDALASTSNIDKEQFYRILESKYDVKRTEIAKKFETVHRALRDIYKIRHIYIERQIIRSLRNRAKQGTYNRNQEIEAFTRITNALINQINIPSQKTVQNSNQDIIPILNKIKQKEQKLKSAERLAAIGETANMIGHDLRNPLQTITSEIYLLKQELKDLPNTSTKTNINESIQSIAEQLTYIDKIVSDLQTYIKPLIITKKPTKLTTLLPATLKEIQIPKNIQVTTRATPELPEILADQELLKKAFKNIAINAIQAMPDGGKLTIKAYASITTKTEIFIHFEDTGVGIPENVRKDIFKPLFTTKSKGQGFGLAVSKRVVEEHGGRIRFTSRPGKGTRFTIKLPINSQNPP